MRPTWLRGRRIEYASRELGFCQIGNDFYGRGVVSTSSFVAFASLVPWQSGLLECTTFG